VEGGRASLGASLRTAGEVDALKRVLLAVLLSVGGEQGIRLTPEALAAADGSLALWELTQTRDVATDFVTLTALRRKTEAV
jgi:hypothetical protein